MKKITLLLLVCFINLSVYGQKLKVNLDREYLPVTFVLLPTHPVLDSNYRTFSVKAEGSQNPQIEDKIILKGFEKVNENGTISVNVSVENIIIDKVDIVKREVSKKDKEGNVKVTVFYKPVVTYTTSATYRISDHTNNRASGSHLGKKENVFEGKEFNRYGDAKNYYNNNRYAFKNNFTSDFINAVSASINSGINRKYGYRIHSANEVLWILDSRKNSDTEGHKKALADIKAAFSTMKYNMPMDDIKENIKPIVAYFESLIPKYNDLEEKKHKKMRYASYYNIATMYFYLEMPDKAIEYANKLIENGYDKGDGEKLIRSSNALKAQFQKNQIDTRHFLIETKDNSRQGNYEEFAEGDENESKNDMKEVYLSAKIITFQKDTIEGKVKIMVKNEINEPTVKDFAPGNSVNLLTLDNFENIVEKTYKAKDIKKLEVNNIEFDPITINPSKENKIPGYKEDFDAEMFGGFSKHFCRVIYKSDIIALYEYHGEIIIKKVSESKGITTSSLPFTIGFEKKLAKLVENCPALAAKAKVGGFKNNEASLTAFVKEYAASCN